MRNSLLLFFVVVFQSTTALNFRLEDSLMSGHFYPLNKNKIPEDPNKNGEDAFSVSPKLMMVCDGLGNSKFPAYYASKLVSLASQQYGISLLEDTSRLPDDSESLREGLEGSINKFLYAYRKMIAEYSFAKDDSAEKEAQLVSLFEELVSKIDPFRKGIDPKSVDVNGQAFDEILKIATTSVSAFLTPNINFQDHMIVYKRGDSLLMQLRPKRLNGSFILDLIYSIQENSQHFNSPGSIRVSDFLTSKKENRLQDKPSSDELQMDMVPVKQNDIVIMGSDGLFDNLPPSMIAILTSAMISLRVQCYYDGIDCHEILIEEFKNIMISFFKATTFQRKINEAIPLFKNFDYLNHPDAIKERVHEAFNANREFKFKEKFDLSDCSIFEIFYLKAYKDKDSKEPWLSNCIRGLIAHHYPIRTSDPKIISKFFRIAKSSDFLTTAAKMVTLFDVYTIRHNEILTLYRETDVANQEKSKNESHSKIWEKEIAAMNEIINKGEYRLSEIKRMIDPDCRAEERKEIEDEIVDLKKSIQEKDTLLESAKNQLQALTGKLSELDKQMPEILNKAKAIKADVIKKGLATLEFLEFVKVIAKEAGLLLHWPDEYQAKSDEVMRTRSVLSVFNIRAKLYSDHSKGRQTSLKYGGKHDDITAVATIVDQDTDHPPKVTDLKERLDSEIKIYAQNLLHSIKLWMKMPPKQKRNQNMII